MGVSVYNVLIKFTVLGENSNTCDTQPAIKEGVQYKLTKDHSVTFEGGELPEYNHTVKLLLAFFVLASATLASERSTSSNIRDC